MKLLLAALLLLLFSVFPGLISPAHAQQAQIVAVCGSPPPPYNSLGSVLPLTMDVTGKLCSNAGAGAPSTPCTTTAFSLQYNAAGSLGCVAGVTSNGTTMTVAANDLILAGVTGLTQCLQASAAGVVTGTGSACGAGGGGTPGGSNTQLQYNAAGSFGGIIGAISNGTTVTFATSDLILGGSSTGTTTFASANAGASNFTITFPAATGTVALVANANVASVSNADGTLTISPTTGAVVASLALGHANTWTAAQTFNNSDILLLGSSTGATTFTSANAGASNFTVTVPPNTGTIAELNIAQTFTAAQIINNSLTLGTQQTSQGTLTLANTAVGAFATTIQSSNSATATATYTLPTAPPAGNGFSLTSTTAGVMSWTNVSGGGGTPCTVTASSLQYNNAGAFGCVTDWTSDGNVLTGALGTITVNQNALTITGTWNATTVATTGASGTGTTATITFAAQTSAYPVGSKVVVAGVTPAGYNGTFVVTASNTTSVSYASATTGAQTVAGTVQQIFDAPLFMNITNTASAAGSLLMDLQLGGVSVIKVGKPSDLIVFQAIGGTNAGGSGDTAELVLNNGGTLSFKTQWSLRGAGAEQWAFGNDINGAKADNFFIYNDGLNETPLYVLGSSTKLVGVTADFGIGFGNASGSGTFIPSLDTVLFRDAAGVLAQRNVGNAQIFRVYNTFASSTNYERGVLDWQTNANVLTIGTEKGSGGGSVRNMEFEIGGVNQLDYGITAAGRWSFPSTAGVNIASGNFSGGLETSNGTQWLGLNAGGIATIIQPSTGLFVWSSTGSPFGTADSGLARNAAGVVEIDNGITAGTFRDLSLRHLRGNGAPTANVCAGFTLATGSSDLDGQVTYTSATTCSITFAAAFTNAPFCMIQPVTALATTQVATSTTGLTATFGTAQTAFQYHCLGL